MKELISEIFEQYQDFFLKEKSKALDRENWYEQLSKLFIKQKKLPVKVFKKCRWEFDSLILKPINTFNEKNVLIKVHDEMFPIASNILENHVMIEKLSSSNYSVHILETFVIDIKDNTPLRVIIYEYNEGQNAYEYLKHENTPNEIIINAFKLCVKGLLDIGIHPYLKDLSDFIILKNNNGQINVRLLDLNACLDISQSTNISRTESLKILYRIIPRFINVSKPYRGVIHSLN